MKYRRNAGLIAGLALVVPLGLAACSDGDPAAGGGGDCELRVGVLSSYTGITAPLGAASEQGVTLGIKSVMEDTPKGPLGCTIKTFKADDAGDPAKALTAARDLVERQKVQAIVGCSPSAATLAASPYTNSRHIPWLTCSASAAVYDTKKFPYNYAMNQAGPAASMAIADYASSLGFKSVTIAIEDSAFGLSQHESLKPEIAKKGIKEVNLVKFPAAGVALDSYALRIKNAAASSDFVWECAQPAQLGRLVQSYKRVGLTKTQFGCNAIVTAEFLASSNGAAPLGTLGIAPAPLWRTDRAATERYVKAYRAAYNKEPTTDAFLYSGLRVWADAVVRAKTADGQKVKAALDQTKDFEGAANTFSFTPDNHFALSTTEDFALAYLVDASKATCSPASFNQSFCDADTLKAKNVPVPSVGAK